MTILNGTPLPRGLRHQVQNLEASAEGWSEVLGAMETSSFYHRREWFEAIRAHLVPEFYFHWIFVGDDPVAIFPLEKAQGTRELNAPTHTELFLRDALVTARGRDLDWERVIATRILGPDGHQPAAVRFHRTPQRSAVGTVLRKQGTRVRHRVSGGRMFCPVSTPDDLSRLSAKNLHNVDRLARRAEREIGFIDSILCTGPTLGDGFETFLRIEAASWKGPDGSGTSLSCRAPARAFFRDTLERFDATQDARVQFLVIGGEPAAALLALRQGPQWSVLKIGFDERFSRWGPGAILLRRFIDEMAADTGVAEVSLVTAPPWADRWHLQQEPVLDIAVFCRTPAGSRRALRHTAIRAARRLLNRVRRSPDA